MGVINANATLNVRNLQDPLPYFDKSGVVLIFTGFEGLLSTYFPDTYELEVGNASTSQYSKAATASISNTAADWYTFSGTPTSNFTLTAGRVYTYTITLNKAIAVTKSVGQYSSTVTVNFGAYGVQTCEIRLKILPAPTSDIITVDTEHRYAHKTQDILNEYPDHYGPKMIKDSVVSKMFNASTGLDIERIENEEMYNLYTQTHMSIARDIVQDLVAVRKLDKAPVRRLPNNLIRNGGFHVVSNPYTLPDWWKVKVTLSELLPIFQQINFDTHEDNPIALSEGVLKINTHAGFSFGTTSWYQDIDVSGVAQNNYSVNLWYKRLGTNAIPGGVVSLFTISTPADSNKAKFRTSMFVTDSVGMNRIQLKIASPYRLSSIQVGIEFENVVSIDPDIADNAVIGVYGITMTPSHDLVPFITNTEDKPAHIQASQDSVEVLHGDRRSIRVEPNEYGKQIHPSSINTQLKNSTAVINQNRNRVFIPDIVLSTGGTFSQSLQVVTPEMQVSRGLPASSIGRLIAIRTDNSEIRHSYRLGFKQPDDYFKTLVAPDAVRIQSILDNQIGGFFGVARIMNHTHMPITKKTRYLLFLADKQLPKPPSHEGEGNIIDYPSSVVATAVYHIPTYPELDMANAIQMDRLNRNTLLISFDNGWSLIVRLNYLYHMVDEANRRIILFDNPTLIDPTAKTVII